MGDWTIPDDKGTTTILLIIGILIGMTACCILQCVKTMVIGPLKYFIIISVGALTFIYVMELGEFWYFQ